MNINEMLYSIYIKIKNRKGRKFKHSVVMAKSYLSSFPEPENDYQRSFFQYKCQKWDTMSFFEVFLSNFASIFLFFPKYLVYRQKRIETEKHYDAVLTLEMLKNKIPKSFEGSYTVQNFNDGRLSREDSKFIWGNIRKHPFAFFFNYKIMCRIAAYSVSISCYSPSIIFSSAEYSFTSSILTEYCEKKGIKHINIMHGEKTFTLIEVFCRFTEFYIWDEYYEELFNSLRANKTEYVIQRMPIPNIEIYSRSNRCTYYLQMHTREQLYNIKKALDETRLDYIVRPHPIYSNGDEIGIFGEEHIEKSSVNIWESIGKTRIAISQDSTVLYQAFLVGVEVALDDISDSEYFVEIKKRGYIMFNKPHFLLSDMMTNKYNQRL